MRRALLFVLLATGLAACGPISTLTEGFKEAKAVETDLEQITGMKPNVGFNWNNGRLTSVNVTFPRVYDGKSLTEFAAEVRSTVTKEFKQSPENIVLAFSLGK
jgi:hypothetical protein